MRVYINGNNMSIVSYHTAEEIDTLMRRRPEVLVLRKEDEETGEKVPVFKISYCEGMPAISRYGVVFSSKSSFGQAVLNVVLPQIPEGMVVEDYVVEKYRNILNNIMVLENRIEESQVFAEIQDETDMLSSMIEVL